MIKINPGKGQARTCLIATAHGKIQTPAFMPDATYGTVQNLSMRDLSTTGIQELVTTTLHIEQSIGSDYIKQFGGMHKFMGWQRPILTDSGGFQVFSLIHRTKNKHNIISDAGCSFIDYKTGDYHFLSPEISLAIQQSLGSDIRVVLDEPIIEDDSVQATKRSVKRTSLWARRSKQAFLKLLNMTEQEFAELKNIRPLLTGVIQGGNRLKYRKQSAEELAEIGFDIYGFGGLPLHDKHSWKANAPKGFYRELIAYVAELIPQDAIRYGLGLGSPDDLRYAVSVGWDIFDSVLPTRNARHGYLYVHHGQGDKEFETFDVLHIEAERYKFDNNPVDSNCKCECCKNISRAYLRHLLRIHDGAGLRLATIHNLHFYADYMRQLRSEFNIAE